VAYNGMRASERVIVLLNTMRIELPEAAIEPA
jgi:hypothetical protein